MRGQLSRVRLGDEDGLTLIELMVSLVIFAIVATGIASGFLAAIRTTGNDRNRLAATNLAQREMEITRNTFTASLTGPQTVIDEGDATNPHPLPGGTAGQPLRVDGRPYTVQRIVRWLPGNTGSSPCDGTSVTYPKISVEVKVTWPGMTANMKPVEINTVLTPPKDVLNSDYSWVAVKLIKANGQPNDGRTVKLASTTGTDTATTAADGCAVFGVRTLGNYNVVLDEAGYVDNNGNPTVSKQIGVTASSYQQLQLSWDQEATLVTRLTTETGYGIPSALTTASIGSTTLTLATNEYTVTAQPSPAPATKIADLWPVTSGYAVWAGTCDQSDPATAGGTKSYTVIAPGGTSDEVPAKLTPLDITLIRDSDDLPYANRILKAKPVSTNGCSTAEKDITLGTTDANGKLKTSLPAGKWIIRDSQATVSGSYMWTTTPTLRPGMGPQTIEVVTP